MIVIERTVDISRPVQTETLSGSEFTGEVQAHTFKIHVVDDGMAVALTGTVTGKVLLANGTGQMLGGSVESGAAVVTLTQPCYEVPGRFHLAIYYTTGTGDDTDTTCIYSAVGNVSNATGSPEYAPGSVIPTPEQLAEMVDELEDAIAENTYPVSYETQTLTDAQKAQARTNIGAAAQKDAFIDPSDAGAMKYLATNVLGTKTTISGNHYVFNYDGSSTTNAFLMNLIGSTVSSGRTTLSDLTLTIDDLGKMMPVSVFGSAIRVGYYCNSRGQTITRNPRIGVVFATVNGDTVTKGSYYALFENVVDTPTETVVTVPAGATHVYLGIYYGGGYNPNTIYDVVYSFRPSNGLPDDLTAPTADGTYTLKVAVTSGVPTYSWVADGASLMMASPMLMTPLNSEDNPEETTEETPDEPTGEEER